VRSTPAHAHATAPAALALGSTTSSMHPVPAPKTKPNRTWPNPAQVGAVHLARLPHPGCVPGSAACAPHSVAHLTAEV